MVDDRLLEALRRVGIGLDADLAHDDLLRAGSAGAG
jgi:hypothetical protein